MDTLMNESTVDLKLDYALLKLLEERELASQRPLAQSLGVSVGKINYCPHSVIAREWVKANNFRCADNKLAYGYIPTPSGAQATMRLVRAFLARKEIEFKLPQQEIYDLRRQIKQQ